MHPDRGGARLSEHPGWRRINAALWALAPLLLLAFALGVSSVIAGRSRDEAANARAVAAENHWYCAKWGLPAGTPEHAVCVRDLVNIRSRIEQTVRQALTADVF